MIKFILFVSKQGRVRLSRYYEDISNDDRLSQESDIVRKCLSRTEKQVLSV